MLQPRLTSTPQGESHVFTALGHFCFYFFICQSLIDLPLMFLFHITCTEAINKCPKGHHLLSEETHSILRQS